MAVAQPISTTFLRFSPAFGDERRQRSEPITQRPLVASGARACTCVRSYCRVSFKTCSAITLVCRHTGVQELFDRFSFCRTLSSSSRLAPCPNSQTMYDVHVRSVSVVNCSGWTFCLPSRLCVIDSKCPSNSLNFPWAAPGQRLANWQGTGAGGRTSTRAGAVEGGHGGATGIATPGGEHRAARLFLRPIF